MITAEIIAIGSELLLGVTIDTNSAYLARQLATVGALVVRKSIVGDNKEHIATAINEARQRADIVICTGGLGPTLDDVTREAVAHACGRPLEFHQPLLDQIAARFASFGRTMSDSNHRQAYIPRGARIIENPRGTAPAFLVEDNRGTVIVLPGVPHEMRFLFETAVLSYMRQELGLRGVILVRVLHVVGLGESIIGERIADFMQMDNPVVGTSASHGRCELRLSAQAESTEAAEAILMPVERGIRERLGDCLLGTESLAEQVMRLLHEHTLSLALYEGNTTAAVYRAISALPAWENHVLGVTIQPPDEFVHEAHLPSLAQAKATQIREHWQCDRAIAIQATPQTDDNDRTSVSIAILSPNGIQHITRHYDLRHSEGWEFVVTATLNLLRRSIIEQ